MKTLLKTVSVIIAAATVLSLCACSKKDADNGIKHYKKSEEAENANIAIDIGDVKVTEAQFAYYYSNAYEYFVQMEMSYRQQGMSLGFPLDKSPDEVSSGQKDDAGNEMYYDKVIADYAANLAYQQFSLYNEAVLSGYILNNEEEMQIDEAITSIHEQAHYSNCSFNDFVKERYSGDLDEKDLRELLEIELIAARYNEDLEKSAFDSITKEQVEAEYKANPNTYNYASIRYYSVTLPSVTIADSETEEDFAKRKEEVQKEKIAEAQAIFDKVTDSESLKAAALEHKNKEIQQGFKPTEGDITVENKGITHTALKTNLSEEAADWVFLADRKVGDKNLFITDREACIMIIEAPAFAGNSVDVRHCLIKFDVKDNNAPTSEQKKDAFEEAEKAKKEFIDTGATEEAFVAIVKKYNDDTASTENGGLYEDIRHSSNYVQNFKYWAVNPARKAGDCEIIETEYGYHVMYFVKSNGPDWEITAREKLQQEAYSDAFEELMGENGKYEMVRNDEIIDRCAKDFCDMIREDVRFTANNSEIIF